MMGKETPYTAGSFPEILCEGGREGGEEGGLYFISELSSDCISQQVDSLLFDWYGMAIENSPISPQCEFTPWADWAMGCTQISAASLLH